jgi:signal transduction histidine kinase
MIDLGNFFQANYSIIRFGYGLTFFVMGLAIALRSRSSSRLALARSLIWLAAFGILYSLYEWGELFSPLQEAYLTPLGTWWLHDAHLLVLACSFVCLFEFGVALLRPLSKGQWMNYLTPLLISAYTVAVLFVLPRIYTDPHIWHNSANALARYAIGFPGALLSAYGLREQAFRNIAPLSAPHIIANLRAAGISLAMFALFGGLLPPPVPFFPGNIFNETSFERLVGIPSLVILALIGFILAVTIIRALEIFEVETERRIELMEQQQILAAERERLARELHDGSIQTVYTASLLVDSARKLAEPNSQIENRLDKAVTVLDAAIRDLRRNLSELRSPPSGEDLASALQSLAYDPRFSSLVDIQVDLALPEHQALSPLRSDHVLAIVTEALSNIIRHAQARHVWIKAHVEQGSLLLTIQDDGSGFPEGIQAGFGLRNMQDRALLLGGNLSISGKDGRGTLVRLEIPWKEEHQASNTVGDYD